MRKSLATRCAVFLFSSTLLTAQELSVERYMPRVIQVGDKALFGNGQQYGGTFTPRVDVYDNSTGVWTAHDLSDLEPYCPSVVAGNKAVYYPGKIAGNTAAVFDAGTGSWSVSSLPQTTTLKLVQVAGNFVVFTNSNLISTTVYIFDGATEQWTMRHFSYLDRPYIRIVHNKVIVAAGYHGTTNDPLGEVYIFDTDQMTWSASMLSVTRNPINPAVVGSKMVFAGGRLGSNNSQVSDAVDIYDAVTNTWSYDTLPIPFGDCTSAVVGNKALFLLIESGKLMACCYDSGNQSWSVQEVSDKRYDFQLTVAGHKVLLAGGHTYDFAQDKYILLDKVEIFDSETDTWHTNKLSSLRWPTQVLVRNGKVFYLGGRVEFDLSVVERLEILSPLIDVYDTALDEWTSYTTENANFVFGFTDSKLYLAGGRTLLPSGLSRLSSKIDVYDFSTAQWSELPIQTPRRGLSLAAFPDRILIAGGRPEVYPGVVHQATKSVEMFKE